VITRRSLLATLAGAAVVAPFLPRPKPETHIEALRRLGWRKPVPQEIGAQFLISWRLDAEREEFVRRLRTIGVETPPLHGNPLIRQDVALDGRATRVMVVWDYLARDDAHAAEVKAHLGRQIEWAMGETFNKDPYHRLPFVSAQTLLDDPSRPAVLDA
jgi:hypothetical protein